MPLTAMSSSTRIQIGSNTFITFANCSVSFLLLTSPLLWYLTGLSDVDQAQQVHQFEEHDHQADDANCLESLRLPPYTHLPLFFYLVFSCSFPRLLPLYFYITGLSIDTCFNPSASHSLTLLHCLFLSLKQCQSLITLFLSHFFPDDSLFSSPPLPF